MGVASLSTWFNNLGLSEFFGERWQLNEGSIVWGGKLLGEADISVSWRDTDKIISGSHHRHAETGFSHRMHRKLLFGINLSAVC